MTRKIDSVVGSLSLATKLTVGAFVVLMTTAVLLAGLRSGHGTPALVTALVGTLCVALSATGFALRLGRGRDTIAGNPLWVGLDLAALGTLGFGLLVYATSGGSQTGRTIVFLGAAAGGLLAFRRLGLRVRGHHALADD